MPAYIAAHEGASGVVKARMDEMKDMAASLKAIGEMVKGETAFDADAAREAAASIAGHSRRIEDLFPEGSDHEPSRAKPIVWKKRAQFAEAATSLVQAAGDLGGASAKGVEALRPALAGVGQACKTCHETFREPED